MWHACGTWILADPDMTLPALCDPTCLTAANHRFLMYSILFELCIAIIISYVPGVNTVFTTQPLHGPHWLLAVPWALAIFGYDEGRKWWMRRHPGGWVDRATAY